MSETSEGMPRKAEKLELPDIAEHAKLVDAAKRQYQSIGSVVTFGSFPKEELDSIYVWWTKYSRTKERIGRLEAAIASPGLPQLEKRQLGKVRKEYEEIVNPIVSQINSLMEKPKLGQADLAEVVGKIQEAPRGSLQRAQAVALGEAIVETTQGEDLDEREIRIRIAQGAWEELLNVFSYARLHYAADTGVEFTTQDDFEEQKQEFIESLKRTPWGKRQTEKNRKVYLGLRKTMKHNGYEQEVLDNFKLVWDTARGTVPEGKSALDVLNASESVLQNLYQEGAFEWDLEELEKEGEEEEEEA